jgi:hypothetical protein
MCHRAFNFDGIEQKQTRLHQVHNATHLGKPDQCPKYYVSQFHPPKNFWGGSLVVDDARSPFALETACDTANKIRAKFVPGSRAS